MKEEERLERVKKAKYKEVRCCSNCKNYETERYTHDNCSHDFPYNCKLLSDTSRGKYHYIQPDGLCNLYKNESEK